MKTAITKPDVEEDIVILWKLSAPAGPQKFFVLTRDGVLKTQPEFKGDISECNVGDVDEFLKKEIGEELLNEFLMVEDHSVKLPSKRSCGSSSNCFVRFNGKEHWFGIWNYGRAEIPKKVKEKAAISIRLTSFLIV